VNEIDEIRQEMARIRYDLNEDVTGVVGGASEAMDWRSYWRAHPWATSGLVLLAGYFLVPKRTKEVQVIRVPTPVPVPAHTTNSTDSQPAGWDQAPPKRGIFSPWRIIGWGLSFAGPLALNAAQAYASVWLENQLGIRPKGADGPQTDGPRNREGRSSTDRRGETSSTNYRPGRG
jgi:hypothetical protein